MPLNTICLIVALVCAILAAFGVVVGRLNLVAFSLAFYYLSLLLVGRI